MRQRLLNVARQRDEDFDLVLTRFALERLLYRLSVSRHADRFVLKGAMLVAVWAPDAFRATRDLDLLARGDNSPEALADVFREVCRVPVPPDGVEFANETVRAEQIREAKSYLGVRAKLEARISGAAIGLQVDVGFGDAVVPSPTSIEYPSVLDFAPAHMQAYTRYGVIAEKLQAIIELGITNTRLKDYFDLYTLASRFELQGPDLVAAIRATFNRRGFPIPEERPAAFSTRFSESPDKVTQWKAFLRRARVHAAASAFPVVVDEVARFVLEPMQAARRQEEFVRRWPPGGPWGDR